MDMGEVEAGMMDIHLKKRYPFTVLCKLYASWKNRKLLESKTFEALRVYIDIIFEGQG